MKIFGRTNLILTFFILISCESIFLKPREFENEFKKYTSDCDSVLYDGDFLHPTYAFMKNGKIKGMEFNANPECGTVIRRYFLNEDEKITKIIFEKDFWSEHCGKPFDSIFVIEFPSKQIKIYTKSTDGKIINNNKLIENEKIDISDFKDEVKKWQYK